MLIKVTKISLKDGLEEERNRRKRNVLQEDIAKRDNKPRGANRALGDPCRDVCNLHD